MQSFSKDHSPLVHVIYPCVEKVRHVFTLPSSCQTLVKQFQTKCSSILYMKYIYRKERKYIVHLLATDQVFENHTYSSSVRDTEQWK